MRAKNRSDARASECEFQEASEPRESIDEEQSDLAFVVGIGAIVFVLGLGLLFAVGWSAMTLAHAVTVITGY